MKKRTEQLLHDLFTRYPSLLICKQDILDALSLLIDCHNSINKILLCGNGGSASDTEHISGELLKGFLCKRECTAEDKDNFLLYGEDGQRLTNNLQQGIKAIPLNVLSSALTAYINDADPELAYAQLTYALGVKNDVLWAISTSGNSKNIYYSALAAKALGLNVLALTGETGGKLKDICDVCIRVPEKETFKIQELHLPIYHFLCSGLESELFVE